MMLDLAKLLLVLLGPALVWTHYARLPDEIPVHFGLTGRPDRWGPRRMIWLVPAVSAAMYLMFAVVQRLPGPSLTKLLMHLLQIETLGLFVSISWSQIQVALGRATRLVPAFWILFALVVVTVPLFALLTGK